MILKSYRVEEIVIDSSKPVILPYYLIYELYKFVSSFERTLFTFLLLPMPSALDHDY
jgi:hypothetical protein